MAFRRPRAQKLALIGCILGAAGAGPLARAAGDAARGKEISYTCLGCHGIEDYKNVYPTYSVPKLLGQHPEYIVAALKEYQSGERSHGTMHVQALSLSVQDMQDIAAYFSSLPLPATGAPVGTPPPRVAQLCVSCHGANGIGITGDYPTLAGQHQDYIARALVEYQQGDRKNAIMPNFVNGISAAEIADIAGYFAQQTPSLQTVSRRATFLSAQ
jgi:cytochrome c553